MFFGDKRTPEEINQDDRRSVLRRHLIYYLRVWDTENDQLLGHVVDITIGGFMLISEAPIELDKTFDLEIRWNSPEDKKVKIKFKATSRWKSNDVNPSFYDTGFQLIDATEKVLDPIREMIEKYGFQN